ncbi:MAG: hypothetical protein ABL856_08630, partial [Gallionella sp.]
EQPLAGSGASTFWSLYEMTKPAALDSAASYSFTLTSMSFNAICCSFIIFSFLNDIKNSAYCTR